MLGRDITAYRLGTPGGRPVLLIGVIHGNEAKGYLITQKIRTMPIPPDIDLWIIDSINPNGPAADTRENANGVDLNRNVSYKWNYIPKSADTAIIGGGTGRSTRNAGVGVVHQRGPADDHHLLDQDANRVSPGGARLKIPLKFADIVGLTTASTPCMPGARDRHSIRQPCRQGRHGIHRRTTGQRRGDPGDGRAARRGDARRDHPLTEAISRGPWPGGRGPCMSRCASRSAIALRLSPFVRPRPIASSTLTWPSLK